MLTLEKFTIGVGDRFAHQAKSQLHAFQLAAAQGVAVVPVWNKSNREHTFIGSHPQSVFDAAQAAVKELNWTGGWHVDADHIRLETVDKFLPCSDFFTIDVADSIGKPPEERYVERFLAKHAELIGTLAIAGISEPFQSTAETVAATARKYLSAAWEAGQISNHIKRAKGAKKFIAEVSMDETDTPQTPPELLIILALLSDAGVYPQTIAPKFTGRFNKGVDYVGDLAQFEREFNDDLAVIAHAVKAYGLPANLKLSVHSGSDKFSLYPIIRRALQRTGAGVHLKTAGTTWLEELIGLAEAGGDGLALAKEIYARAHKKQDELCAPYASVIDIDATKLPAARVVDGWNAEQFIGALRHEPANPAFNPSLRQLVHVGFKVAAQMGDRYLKMLETCEPSITRNVTGNLYDRHLKPLFIS